MGEGGAGPIVTTSPEARHKRPCLERRQSFHEPFAKETSMKTLSMKVENIGFLIDHMGRGCGADQYIRELTQNAIEAVVRTGRGSTPRSGLALELAGLVLAVPVAGHGGLLGAGAHASR